MPAGLACRIITALCKPRVLITPESSHEHDVLLRRLRAIQHLLGSVPLTVLPLNSYPVTVRCFDPDASDQTRAC